MPSINPKDLSIKDRHRLLLTAIGPRPIAWVSTVDSDGNPNLAPFSFFNIFSSNPPIIVFSPARSGRTNTTKHTLDNVHICPEAVVHIVTAELVDQMVMTSLEYPVGVNEFDKAGLSMLPSDLVSVPRIKESPVALECKVLEIKALGTEGAAGNMVICEVVKIHVHDDAVNKEGQLDQLALNLVGRMGGAWYTKAYGEALYEISSNPMNTVVGYDQIPFYAKTSEEITGAELHQLAHCDSLPDESFVNEYKLTELSDIFTESIDEPSQLAMKLVTHCKACIKADDLKAAWSCLLSFEP